MTFSSSSRALLIVFCVYIFCAFSVKYLPKSAREVVIFVFLFLLNTGVQAACFHLLKISNAWQTKMVVGMQVLLAAWSVYVFRFVYEAGYTGDKVHLILDTPLQQWVIVIVMLAVIFFTNKERGS
jgi:hypothetical protein